jgi:hypothetical protein
VEKPWISWYDHLSLKAVHKKTAYKQTVYSSYVACTEIITVYLASFNLFAWKPHSERVEVCNKQH